MADHVGVYGISFVVCLSNVILFKIIREIFDKKFSWSESEGRIYRQQYLTNLVVILVVFVGFFYLYGARTLKVRERYVQDPDRVSLKVSVLQGNIPQEQKWDAKIKAIIFEKYKRLMMIAALEKTDLIVWPETSFPGYLEDEPLMAVKLRSSIRQGTVSTLVGAPTLGDLERGLRFYNSAVLFSTAGEEIKRYSKIHLVPFGEYMPLGGALEFVRNFFKVPNFSPGTERVIFQARSRSRQMTTKSNFAVLICFEDLFPDLVRSFCRDGAEFLVSITNDAWFGKSSASYQHGQSMVFRAIENRVNMARAANTGYSFFVSPEGRILSAVQDQGKEIFVSGHKSQELVIKKTPTFYTRYGDLFVFLCAGLCFLAYQDKHKRSHYSKF
jgi:apolipoprotein N-acyltransferase